MVRQAYDAQKRHLASFSVVVFFSLLAAGSIDTDTDTKEVQSRAVAYTLSADALFGEYEANEVAADIKYKGKVVVVSGRVENIGKDILDQAYVVIGGQGFLDGVQCTFSKGENVAIAQLSKSQPITVKGEVSGKMGNVQVTGCQLR